MTSEQLRASRDAVPFLPFSIHLADGRSFRVPHRDYLSISPHGRIAFVYRVENEAFNTVDVMLITDLTVEGALPHPEEQPTPTSENPPTA